MSVVLYICTLERKKIIKGWFSLMNILQQETLIYLSTLLFIFFNLIQSSLPDTRYSTRTIETAYGSLRGIIIPKSGDLPRDVEGYLGIPYASSPAASLRFMPPLTPSHWEGVRMADKFGPVCPQLLPDISNRTRALNRMPLLKYTRLLEISRLLSNQSEDCLHLNIYRPVEDEKKIQSSNINGGGGKKPGAMGALAIVVILQGDSWEWGSGNLVDGSALASVGQLLVITLNYRLGALGFLQTSSQQGNFAIMDVVAALNWISQNGNAFGADVNRVTLLGHRTGAVLANFLMLAPVATELFHRVILLSGSVVSPWSFQRHAKTNVRKLAQFFKCISESSIPSGSGGIPPFIRPNAQQIPSSSSSSSNSMNSGSSGINGIDIREFGPCLRDIPLDQFLEAITSELLHPRFIARFGPLIDGTVVKSDFISEMKYDTSGHFSRIQLLLGTSSVESFGELNTEDIEDGLQEIKRDRILRTLVRNIFVFHLNEIFSTIKNEYTDWEKPRKDFIDVRDSILNILSDGLTVAPLLQVAAMHSNKPKAAKTYFFHFQYEPDNSVYPQRIGSISEDLLEFSVGHPVLNTLGNEPSLPSYTQNDAKVSVSLLHYLTNFIITGDPNSGYETTSVEDAQLTFWDSYDPINQLYLEIGSGEPRMRSHYKGHKMALWLNLIPQLHQSGGADVSMLHHNFREEKPEFYEGPVREQLKHPPTYDLPGSNPRVKPAIRHETVVKSSDSDLDDMIGPGIPSSEDYENESPPQGNRNKNILNPTQAPAVMSSSECPPNSTTTTNSGAVAAGGAGVIFNRNVTSSSGGIQPNSIGGTDGTSTGGSDRELVRQLATSHYHSYGTALGVTIGVGCCLLLLNLLIFLAIYHQKTHNPPVRKNPTNDDDEGCGSTRPSGPCRHHPNGPRGFPYGDIGSVEDDYEEEDLIRELRHCGGGGSSGGGETSTVYLHKEMSSSSGFSSPPIPEPPPPPRSIPPSLGGSMASITSSMSASAAVVAAAGGTLRRQSERPIVLERDHHSSSQDYDRESCSGGSMKKRVQIQEISV